MLCNTLLGERVRGRQSERQRFASSFCALRLIRRDNEKKGIISNPYRQHAWYRGTNILLVIKKGLYLLKAH